MASTGSMPDGRERRAVGRLGRGLAVGLIAGGVIGAIAGLVVGAIAFEGTAAMLAAALGGAIFGGGLGAFWGGMSRLEDPPPGQEPGVREQPLTRPGLTHEEHDR